MRRSCSLTQICKIRTWRVLENVSRAAFTPNGADDMVGANERGSGWVMSIVEIMLEQVSVLQIPTWGIGLANLLWKTYDAPVLDLPALTPSELSFWMKKDIQTDNLQSSKTIASQRRWNKKRGPPLTDGVLKSRFTEQCGASTKRTYSANGESKCVCVRMCVCVCVCVCVHVCRMYLCVYMNVGLCVYVSDFVCVCVCCVHVRKASMT